MIEFDKLFKGNFVMVSKVVIRELGLEAAVMLSELYSEYLYWKASNGLTEAGYFYSTMENVKNNTGLTRARQDSAIKVLEKAGIIKKYVHGMPAKRYFKLIDSGVKRFNDSGEEDRRSTFQARY